MRRPHPERRRAGPLLARQLGRRTGIDRVHHPPQDPRDPGRRGVDPRPLPLGHLGLLRREGSREFPPVRGRRSRVPRSSPSCRLTARGRGSSGVCPRARTSSRSGLKEMEARDSAVSRRFAGDAREGPRPLRARRVARRVPSPARHRRRLGDAAAGGAASRGRHLGAGTPDPRGGRGRVLPDDGARVRCGRRSARTIPGTRRRFRAFRERALFNYVQGVCPYATGSMSEKITEHEMLYCPTASAPEGFEILDPARSRSTRMRATTGS